LEIQAVITVFSDEHRKHAPRREFHRGKFVGSFEKPKRARIIRSSIRKSKLGPVIPPEDFGIGPILRIHAADYLDFLRTIHQRWREADEEAGTIALPHTWTCRDLRQVRPENVFGQLGYYSFDIDTPITEGTWRAAYMSAQVALTGQKLVAEGEKVAFALCRPPGHHASCDVYGGYCFLNNAAIAAQAFRDGGARLVAVLDVDYHHGNGTQAIFYDRRDVLFVSLHAHPSSDYPYFLGYEDEKGTGEGEGFTANYPLPQGTRWTRYRIALAEALERIGAFGPDALVVSLGVDTFAGDPVAVPGFQLLSQDFPSIGRMIARLGLPTLFVMEGGYSIDPLGENVVRVLSGFEKAARG
jgi:acetoin utilization deacetylase AcuC-like enzyme